MSKGPKVPPLPTELSAILNSKAIADHAERQGQVLADAQVQAIMDLLIARGHVLPVGPTAEEAHNAAGRFATQFIFAELVVKLLRTMLLAGVIVPESVQALNWLKAYIDGNGHGPVGQPMRWPEGLVATGALLRVHGFEPTDDGWVRKARKGETPSLN